MSLGQDEALLKVLVQMSSFQRLEDLWGLHFRLWRNRTCVESWLAARTPEDPLWNKVLGIRTRLQTELTSVSYRIQNETRPSYRR